MTETIQEPIIVSANENKRQQILDAFAEIQELKKRVDKLLAECGDK